MENIKLASHRGTWYVIQQKIIQGKLLYLLEHEDLGDETSHIITDKNFTIVMEDVLNGFDDYLYLLQEALNN